MKKLSLMMVSGVLASVALVAAAQAGNKQAECAEYGAYQDAEGLWITCEESDLGNQDSYQYEEEAVAAESEEYSEDMESQPETGDTDQPEDEQSY